jgi:hypothetical protein
MIGVDSARLWDDAAGQNIAEAGGNVDHVVTLTGVAYDLETGALSGFYIVDSGRGLVTDMTRYVPIAHFRAAANVPRAHAVYTIEPIKLWDEDIHATGNALGNTIEGNRGDNVLDGRDGSDTIIGAQGNDTLIGGQGDDELIGGPGNDMLIGEQGNDMYFFERGDGHDVIVDTDAHPAHIDVLQFGRGISQGHLQMERVDNDLEIHIADTRDSVTVRNWFLGSAHQIEEIRIAEEDTLTNLDVAQWLLDLLAPPATMRAASLEQPITTLESSTIDRLATLPGAEPMYQEYEPTSAGIMTKVIQDVAAIAARDPSLMASLQQDELVGATNKAMPRAVSLARSILDLAALAAKDPAQIASLELEDRTPLANELAPPGMTMASPGQPATMSSPAAPGGLHPFKATARPVPLSPLRTPVTPMPSAIRV